MINYLAKAIKGRKGLFCSQFQLTSSWRRLGSRDGKQRIILHPQTRAERERICACYAWLAFPTLMQSRMPLTREWWHPQWASLSTNQESPSPTCPHANQIHTPLYCDSFPGNSRVCQLKLTPAETREVAQGYLTPLAEVWFPALTLGSSATLSTPVLRDPKPFWPLRATACT